jgi:hypothetical protein
MLTSAHDFIRTLKAVEEPEDGPKIELAAEAWTTTSLYIPSKDEIIAEWLLGQLAKHECVKRCTQRQIAV